MVRLGWAVILVAAGLATLGAWALASQGLPVVAAVLVAVNVVTVLGYGYDKHQARCGGWRVPEMALHFLSVAGGTPGAFLAQRLFHHKTRDLRFQAIFWAIAAAQVMALLAVMSRRNR